MALHEVQLKGYSVRPGNLSLGTFDSYGIEQLHVTADDSWDGLDILAVFHAPNGDAKKVVVGADGMLNVPPEATAKQAGNGKIVFVGLAENVQRITVDMGYNIKPHSDIEGDNPGVPTPDVVQQILQAALNAEQNSAEANSVADGLRNDAANGKFNGKDGAKGDKGETGITPQLKIGKDNLWQVSYDNGATWVSLGVKATGATGKDGADGLTPYIGENGNWWLGNTDTGVSAKGPKGDPGPQGPAGEIPEDYPQIREDVSKLKEDLGEITEEYSKDITAEIEWIDGKWHAGSAINDERGHKGAYVPVNAGEKYTITGDLFNLQDLYGLYDSDKKKISYYPNPSTQHIPFVKMSATITIPSGVAYIFVSTVIRNSDMGLVEDFSLFKNGVLRAKAEAVASEAKLVASEAVPKVVKYPNLLDWTNSEVGQLNNQGVLNPSGTALTTTDYIPVEAGKNIYQSRAGVKYAYVYNPVAFYDSTKGFISPAIYGGTEYVTVPSNAKYMRVSVLNTNISMGVQMEYDRITEYHEAGSYNIIEKIENDIQSKSSVSDVGFEDNIIHERIIDSQLKNDFSWGTIDGLYATITFDDTNTDIDILEDLAEELNIPFCFATIPSYLSRTMSKGTETASQTLKRAVVNGGEVLSHWQLPLTSASTESDYYEVYAGAKRTLENAGFKVNGLITAGGYNNGLEFKTQDFDKSTKYGRIYYQYGDLTALNNHNVEQFFNERTFTDGGVADMKARIDAIATQGHGWLNMASHGTPTGNASNTLTISDFRQIFQYAKDKGFTFVTWNTMYEKFKSSKLEKRVKALEIN